MELILSVCIYLDTETKGDVHRHAIRTGMIIEIQIDFKGNRGCKLCRLLQLTSLGQLGYFQFSEYVYSEMGNALTNLLVKFKFKVQ